MRILGTDIGTSSIKAVELDSAFGRFEIRDYHEQPIAAGESPETAVMTLIKKLPKTPDRIVTSLATSLTTFRNLQLPTRDKKAIQASVGFELEDELPFSSDEAFFDYLILQQNRQGSLIHVAASLKKHLTATLENWQKVQFSPDTITTEVWAYRTLLNRILGPAGASAPPTLLVQMGNERTTLYLHWEGAPVLIREMRWGGRDLTRAISMKYGIPLEQAESKKLDHGLIAPLSTIADITPEQNEFSACMEIPLEKLIGELRQIGLICRNVNHHSIGLIYIAGGTSLLPGLGAWIEERMKIPTKPLLALSSTTQSGVTYSDQTDARFLLAASLALTQAGPDRTKCITFRKAEFSKVGQTRQFNTQALKKPIMASSFVVFCLFLSLIVQGSVYQSRLASTDVLLEKSVRSFFGQISSGALRTYMSNTSTLRSSIQKELSKQKELAKLFGANTHSPLNLLSGLSGSIPRDIVVDMVQFQAGQSATEPFSDSDQNVSASLTFWVANPQMAEKLASILGSKLGNIQRGKMEEVSSIEAGASKKWKINFSGKPNEESYGK